MPTKIVRVSLDGNTYDIDFSDLTAVDAGLFRTHVGFALAAVLNGTKDGDIDAIAGLVWLYRRKHGEPHLQFGDVAKTINFMSDLGYEPVEVEPDPET